MKQMIKRKDGSTSQRGLWDNIRANRGSGKKPTSEMLKQERKIKAKMEEGGIMNPGFKALPGYVQAKIKSNMQEGGKTTPGQIAPFEDYNPDVFAGNTTQGQLASFESNNPDMFAGRTTVGQLAPLPQSAAGKSVLKEAMGMSKMQDGGKMPNSIARARFMAASNGNIGQAKETASKYGYKMQTGGYKPSFRIGDRGNYSGSDNTMVGNNPVMMQQQLAQGQMMKNQASTTEGQAQMATGKQKAQSSLAAAKAKRAQQEAQAKAKQVADMKTRIADSNQVQDMSLSNQFKPENIARATQATGDKLRLFGPSSPLVTSGLFEADPNSFLDNYVNPAKFVGDMATNLGQGINETAQTGNFGAVGKALATPLVAGATMGYLKSPMHSLEKKAVSSLTRGINSSAANVAFSAPALAGGIEVGANLAGKGISRTTKTLGQSAEHDVAHKTTEPTMLGVHKNGGSIRDMYYMKNGGQFPDRYKKMGFSGVDKPKKTTSGGKSHAVVTKVDGNYKLIRFGQAGVTGSPDGSARNKAFKARHAKNIAKGKSSAAFWANKIKW